MIGMWLIIALILLAGAGAAAALALAIRRKNVGYWLKSYILPPQPHEPEQPGEPLHIFIAVCDHWEPQLGGAPRDTAMAKVENWAREYPRMFEQFRDTSGRVPQHTFFFPAEEYRPEYIDRIGDLCHAGFGDVDVHLHHHNDTAAGFEDKLEQFRQTLFHRHGLLRRDPRTGQIAYGFIHGNWSLCNSRPDGAWCGVDHELGILLKTGCYADFTMPSAPSPTQTRIINSIYYARDIPGRRKSHDEGRLAAVGQPAPDNHLLMIQGPLTLDWERRQKGIIPRIENGDLIAGRPPSLSRMKYWRSAGVHVRGMPNWLFVKLHTHGCNDANMKAWLGGEMQQFHRELAQWAKSDKQIRYHYVTAWEMAQLVHQAEAGAAEPVISANLALAAP